MGFRAELIITSGIGLLALVGIWVSYRQSKNSGENFITWASKWFADFSTELAGSALITFLILLIVLPAQKQDRKEELIRLMSSSDNIAARQASENLYFLYEDGRARWDGSLRNRDFAQADWTDMHLAWATLGGSDLTNAILVHAHIVDAELVDVNLSRANLSGADLSYTDLTGATIASETVFSETTHLPDGTFWTSDTDMSRFTDPDNPEYWDPCVFGRAPSCW